MVLLETILIILLIYFGLKFIWKVSKPYVMRYISKKINQRFENAFQGTPFQQASNNSQPNSKSKPKQKQKFTEKKKVGEYIDFEEIEE